MRERLRFLKAVFIRPWVGLVTAIYAYLSAGDWVADKVLSGESLARWQHYSVAPHWSVQTWVIVFLTTSLVVTCEGAFRLSRQNQTQLAKITDALKAKTNLAEFKTTIAQLMHEATWLEGKCSKKLDADLAVLQLQAQDHANRTESIFLSQTDDESYLFRYRAVTATDDPPSAEELLHFGNGSLHLAILRAIRARRKFLEKVIGEIGPSLRS